MGEKSKISWTDSTFNSWWGCTNVSPGCDHCYAESFAHRLGLDVWGKTSGRRFFGDNHWRQPLIWNDKAKKSGRPFRVFCGSMCDILDEWRGSPPVEGDILTQQRERLWKLIEATPNLIWLLLTKRPQNYKRMLPAEWCNNYPPQNVCLMTTVESPEYLWRIKELMLVPARWHAVSWEPALAYVDFKPWMAEKCCSGFECGCRGLPVNPPPYLDWVIAGGESGGGYRGFNIEWARQVRVDCHRGNASFFMKQLGGWPDKQDDPSKWPEDIRVQEFPR